VQGRRLVGAEAPRDFQVRAWDALAARRHVLVVQPTGGGKSAVYQALALAGGKLTIVITPLISLARDQVSELNERVQRELGDATPDFAAALGGAATEADALQRALSGQYSLLYVSPETLQTVAPLLAWADRVGRIEVGAVAIDEAHCTRWASWRAAYGVVAELLEAHLPNVPRVALTATASAEQVEFELPAACGLRLLPGDTLVGFVERPNLESRVVVGRTARNFRWAVLGDDADDGEAGEEGAEGEESDLLDEDGGDEGEDSGEEGEEGSAATDVAASAAHAEAVMAAEAVAEEQSMAAERGKGVAK
jgi:superfamily II DNA helicase RecQ